MHRTYSQTIAAEFSEVRAASTASGGSALTTTASLISIPFGTNWISLTPRNFVACNVARYLLNPYLLIVRTSDALVTTGNLSDISDEMQDGDTTTASFNSFDIAANGDFLYVGAAIPFRGAAVDVTNTNTVGGTTLTVKYWNGAWSDISATDGTTSGADTFGVDGNVTWTVPATWVKTSLFASGDTLLRSSWSGVDLYWTRWETNAIFDTTVSVAQIRALNRSTAYSEWLEGQTYEQAIQTGGPGGVACIEALTDAGTANLLVNVATGRGETFA